MTQTITENINTMLSYRSRIFWFLAPGIVILTLFYVNLIHSTIVNVVEREKVVSEIREKSTLVSEMESNYVATKDKINMDMARSKGFQDSEVTSFISTKSLTAFVQHNEL